MKKIYIPMIRYGEKEFDEGFIGWGFNSYDDAIRDANAVLGLMGQKHMEILDLACGLGIYHKVWLEAGHSVTGTDLSDTFIFMANNNNSSFPNAQYRVENFYDLNEEERYDLVTLIDTPVEDAELPANVLRALKPGGCFLCQVPNPNYKHPRGPLFVNHRDWKENDDRTLLLTRHEYNAEIDRWEYEEWHVDIEKAEIVVEHHFSRNLTAQAVAELLLGAGFIRVGLFDQQGRPADSTRDEPRSFFALAYKGE